MRNLFLLIIGVRCRGWLVDYRWFIVWSRLEWELFLCVRMFMYLLVDLVDLSIWCSGLVSVECGLILINVLCFGFCRIWLMVVEK